MLDLVTQNLRRKITQYAVDRYEEPALEIKLEVAEDLLQVGQNGEEEENQVGGILHLIGKLEEATENLTARLVYRCWFVSCWIPVWYVREVCW